MWQQRAKQLNEYFNDNNKEKAKRRKSKSVSEEVKSNKRDSINSDSELGSEKKSPHTPRKISKKVEQT